MRLSEKFSLLDDLSDEGKWVFAVIVSVVCRCCCCLLLLLLLLSLLLLPSALVAVAAGNGVE